MRSSSALPPQQLPPLRALQAFEAVARSGSVMAAAQEMGVSPGAVSQQVRKLEELLDLRLFERRGKGMELSTWGQLYHQELGTAFDLLRTAQQSLWRMRTESGLTVSCLSSVASKWLGTLLFEWQAMHSASRLRLVGAESEPDLKGGETDFRISYGAQSRHHLHHVELFTDWVVPVCAPELLAAHPAQTPEQVLALPLIAIDWESVHLPPPGWSDWARSVGMDTRDAGSKLTFSLSSAAIDAALSGRGLVLAPMGMITGDLAEGRLVLPFDHRLQLPQPYFLAWDLAALNKPFGHDFRKWVLAAGRRQAQISSGAIALSRLKSRASSRLTNP
ncbi:MAG: LysR family transcriptional regulator [Rhodoferax sp.]|nr:LysR family transcriptional regulator [Rhodoferax sp.]MBP7492714.1 LysR family transcriptional regulator [Rhodoferax sp.]